jgi:hypothetical protein
VTVFGQSTTATATSLKQMTSFDLVETRVAAVEFVKGLSNERPGHSSDLVWMGTDSRKLIVYAANEPEKQEELGSYPVSGPVVQIKYHYDNVFVALGTGSLLMFRRQYDGAWNLKEPGIITLGEHRHPVTERVTSLKSASSSLLLIPFCFGSRRARARQVRIRSRASCPSTPRCTRPAARRSGC